MRASVCMYVCRWKGFVRKLAKFLVNEGRRDIEKQLLTLTTCKNNLNANILTHMSPRTWPIYNKYSISIRKHWSSSINTHTHAHFEIVGMEFNWNFIHSEREHMAANGHTHTHTHIYKIPHICTYIHTYTSLKCGRRRHVNKAKLRRMGMRAAVVCRKLD